jgi:hypothetical protein
MALNPPKTKILLIGWDFGFHFPAALVTQIDLENDLGPDCSSEYYYFFLSWKKLLLKELKDQELALPYPLRNCLVPLNIKNTPNKCFNDPSYYIMDEVAVNSSGSNNEIQKLQIQELTAQVLDLLTPRSGVKDRIAGHHNHEPQIFGQVAMVILVDHFA